MVGEDCPVVKEIPLISVRASAVSVIIQTPCLLPPTRIEATESSFLKRLPMGLVSKRDDEMLNRSLITDKPSKEEGGV